MLKVRRSTDFRAQLSHDAPTSTQRSLLTWHAACAQLLSELLEESEDVAPGWVAALLQALVPPSPAERARLAGAVLQREEAQLALPAQRRVEALLDAAAPAADDMVGDEAAAAPRVTSSDPLVRALPALVVALSALWPGMLLTLSPAFDAALSGDDARRAQAVSVLGALFAAPRSAAAGEYRQLFAAFLARFRDRSPAIREAMARWAGTFLVAFTPRHKLNAIAAPPPDTPACGDGDASCTPLGEVCLRLETTLRDYESNVRAAAGASVAAVAASHPARVPARLLALACNLLLDKKTALRRDMLRSLAAAYAAYAGRDCRGAPGVAPPAHAAALFDALPGALLCACATDPDLGRTTAESLLDGGLVPHSLTPEAAADVWARAHAAADATGAKAIEAAIRLRAEARSAAATWLQARRAQRAAEAAVGKHDDDEMGDDTDDTAAGRAGATPHVSAAAAGALVDRGLVALSRCFPSPPDALAALRKLHAARDGHIFRALEGLLGGDVSLYGSAGAAPVPPAAVALRTDAQRRLGAKHPAAETMKALCVKIAPAPLDAAAIGVLLARIAAAAPSRAGDSDDSGDEDGHGDQDALPCEVTSALALLVASASGAPALFATSLPALLPLLVPPRHAAAPRRASALLDGALRVLQAAAPGLRGMPAAATPALRAALTTLATCGSVRQAKRSAAALVTLQRDAAPALAAGLLDALPQLCDDAAAPALGALGALAAAAPDIAEPHVVAMQRFVTHALLPRVLSAPPRGPAAGGVHPVVALKARGVTALARACSPLLHLSLSVTPAAAVRASALVKDVLEPLLRASGPLYAAASGGATLGSPNACALRAAAARALLKLARFRHDAALPPSAFEALAASALDAAPAVRAAVLAPLLKAARTRRLPSVRVCSLLPLALSAAERDDPKGTGVAGEARRALAAFVDTMRANADSDTATGAAATASRPPVTRAPEFMLMYLLWALSRHPAVPATPAAALTAKCDTWLAVVQPPLRALCDALLSPARPQLGAFVSAPSGSSTMTPSAGASLPLLLKLARAVKMAEDASDASRNYALYALADVTSALLVRTARAKGWDTTAQCAVSAPLPSRYFTIAAAPRLGPLSPAAAAGNVARPRPSASFLPAHFALLPDEETHAPSAQGAARPKASPRKRRRAAAAARDSDDSDDDDEREPVPRRPAKRAGSAAVASKPIAAATRLQPRRGAARAARLADLSSDNADEDDEAVALSPKPKAPAPEHAAPAPALPSPDGDGDVLAAAPEHGDDVGMAATLAHVPPSRGEALRVPAAPPLLGNSSDEEDYERALALRPKRREKPAAPTLPAPVVHEDLDMADANEDPQLRKSGRRHRRR